MSAMEIMEEMKSIGYRVVPDFVSKQRRFEIIIEPWNWDANIKNPGRVRRTGYFFLPTECSCKRDKETEFEKKMKEVQLKLINHFKSKIV